VNIETKVSSDEQLLALTREMFEHAEAGDWEQLADLEKSRLPLFNQVFDQGVSGNVKLAREVLSMDEKTKSLAEAGMSILQQEILKLKNSSKVNSAYQAIQKLTSGDG